VGAPAVEPAVEKAPVQTPRPKPKPSAVFIVAKEPIQIRERDGRFAVFAGRKVGLAQGMELKVVGAAGSNGKRKVLGNAVVQELRQGRAVLTLDEAASKAGGDRFAVLPKELAAEAPDAEAETEAEAAPAPPAPEPAAPAAPARTLALGVRRTSLMGLGPLDKGFTLHNAESKIVSNCKATIHRRMQYVFRSLVLGQTKIKRNQFKPDAAAPVVPEGRMLIECDEGRADVEIQN
jgi:hypothetical protein